MIVLYYRLSLSICINNVSVQIIGGGLDARICFDGGYMGASTAVPQKCGFIVGSEPISC